jgi:hypothetical protein
LDVTVIVTFCAGAFASTVTVPLICVSEALVLAYDKIPVPVTDRLGLVPNPAPLREKDVVVPASHTLGETEVIAGAGS